MTDLFADATTEQLRAELQQLKNVPLQGVDELTRQLMQEELDNREHNAVLHKDQQAVQITAVNISDILDGIVDLATEVPDQLQPIQEALDKAYAILNDAYESIDY